MQEYFLASAWSNGSISDLSVGYGLRIAKSDRDKFFKREWKSVIIRIEDCSESIEVNINKASFWDGNCRELINAQIGRWMIRAGIAPWPKRKPPKVKLTSAGVAAFDIQKF